MCQYRQDGKKKSLRKSTNPAKAKAKRACLPHQSPLAMSPPQFDHVSPPVLVDDAMREIFLRIPPDDPATLVRSSAVCTAWRGIISDADFGREYRAFHNTWETLASHFTSTTASFRSPVCHDRQDWHALDSRHGLVLFRTHHGSE